MIPLIKPTIDFDLVSEDIKSILESGQLTSGKYVADFERQIADYVGCKYAISTTSATTAMHLVLEGFGIGPGDEVLVSDFTFPATGNVIIQCGAVPVLVDCNIGQFDINIDDLVSKITKKSRAILVVHPFGQPANMNEIIQIAQKHDLIVIEDAACALGSEFEDGKKCGSLGHVGCFSFHPRKLLTTGEGGMITTNDDELYQALSLLRAHGGQRAEVGLEFMKNGYNYRMTEIQACLGLRQLPGFDAVIEERRKLAETYVKNLKAVNGITAPLSSSLECCSIQSFVVLLDSHINRNKVSRKLREMGIESTLGTYAMHRHPAFRKFNYKPGDLPNSDIAERYSLTLPLFAGMGDEIIAHICEKLKEAIQ